MPGRKIFSAEKELMDRLGGQNKQSTPTLESINENLLDLKNDFKFLKGLLRQTPSENGEEHSQLEAAMEQVAVDKLEFEKHKQEIDNLKEELQEISDTIENTKNDIAELAPITQTKDDGLDAVTSELDSITDATEKAADEILEMTENIEAVAESIKAENNDNNHLANQADEILRFTATIFEACNFQDLTGQRITRAIKTLNFVSDRINHIIDIWGSKDLIETKEKPVLGIREDCGVTISGPATDGEGIAQDDIDKLFDQDDIDSLFD